MSVSDLIDTIDSIITTKYIKKPARQIVTTDLNLIKQSVTDKSEIQLIESVIEIVRETKLDAVLKKRLTQMKPQIETIVDRYIEEYENNDNIDEIEVNKKPEDVEVLLDAKVDKYNRYSEHHPMKGITYDPSKGMYKVQTDCIRYKLTVLISMLKI